MSTPRFTVGSVSGYSGEGGPDSRWSTIWYVHDRAHGYAIVRTFRKGGKGARDTEANARSLAEFLNGDSEVVRACQSCDTPITPQLVMHQSAWRWRLYCSRACARAGFRDRFVGMKVERLEAA